MNLLRVTQINAVRFDDEIHKILLRCTDDILKLLPPGYTATVDAEIRLLIKLLTLYYSIVDSGSTFGQKMLCTRYEDVGTVKTILYVVCSCFNYVADKIQTMSSRRLEDHIQKVISFIQLCNFINTSLFLRYGTKPRLVDRILNLKQVYSDDITHRNYQTQYMTRELLWSSFIELLIYILPLINYHKMKRIVRNLSVFRANTTLSAGQSRSYDLNTCCSHCSETPVLPHHMGCSHVFCYSCLKGNHIADSKYECPICGYSSDLCERIST